MSTEESSNFMVVDNGSGQVKAGFAGDDAPRALFPSVIGIPKQHSVMLGAESKSKYVGDEAIAKKGVLKLTYPVEHGMVTDWEHMKLLWNHTFHDQLRVDDLTAYSIMLTEPSQNPKQNREKMVQTMFDDYGFQSCFIAVQAVLSLYASGRTTGLVLDSGDGVSHIVPIYDGFSMPASVIRLDLAGREVTERFQKLLCESGINLRTSAELEICRDIKEKTSYIADDYEAELERCKNVDYLYQIVKKHKLPDGNVIDVGTERFCAPECLFQPNMSNMEFPGIHTQIYNSIVASDIDTRTQLYKNIVLSGGTTLIENLGNRLEAELRQSAPTTVKIKIIAPPERKYSVWIGGSILASLSTFSNTCVSRTEYEDEGINIIHKKFIS